MYLLKNVKKIVVLLLKKIDLGSALAIRIIKFTSSSKLPIHPKHFIDQDVWFKEYLEPKDDLLDIGCGVGQASIKSSKYVNKVFAVDKDKGLLETAKKIANSKKIKNITFEAANLEKQLNYKNNVFDKVVFLDVLEHLNQEKMILQEIKRVLKKNGLLFIGVPNSQTSWKKFQRSAGVCSFSDPDHKREYSEKQIRQLLNKLKFKIIEFNFGKFDTPMRGIFDVIGAFSIPIYKKISNWRQRKAIEKPTEASGFEIIAQNL